jgi:hypothetical protein
MHTNKKVTTTILSAASTFVLLKLSKNKIDPFTRAFLGTNLGICTAALGSMTENQLVKTIGRKAQRLFLITLEVTFTPCMKQKVLRN